MAYSRKIILLSLVFAGVAFFVSSFNYSPKKAGKANSKTINLPVSGWLCKPITSSQAVLDTLETDITVFADYYRGDEGPVNLYVGYYDTVLQAKMSHAPQVCFTAQGWILRKNDKVQILLDGEKQTVNRLLLEKNKQKTLVYYWYQSGRDIYADIFRLKVALLFKKISHPKSFNEGNAFVRVSTSAANDQQKAALLLEKFIHPLYRDVERIK